MYKRLNWMLYAAILLGILMLEGCKETTIAPKRKPPALVRIPGVTEPGQIPCLKGVWEGLEMGRTTEAELRQWLKTSHAVSTIFENFSRVSVDGIQEYVYRWDLTGGFGWWLEIDVISETVSSAHFPVLYPLTLAQVIEQIGEPEYVLAGDIYYGPHCFYEVEFDYPHLGLIVVTDRLPCDGIQQDWVAGEKTGPLEPNFRVGFIRCSQPGTLEEVIQRIYVTSPKGAAMAASRRHQWSGFGRIRLFRPFMGNTPTPLVQP